MATFSYKVRGRWPFPVDMLRFDGSAPATEADRALMSRLSAEHCEDVSYIRDENEVTLVREGVRDLPFGSALRWQSFSWHVVSNSVHRVTDQAPVEKVVFARDALPVQGEETYLGDGLYASFDGFHVKLRAPREGGDHVVGLEPQVYRALQSWIERFPRMQRHLEGG